MGKVVSRLAACGGLATRVAPIDNRRAACQAAPQMWQLVSVRPVVATVAADDGAAREAVPGQAAVSLRLRQDGSAIVGSVARLAGSLVASGHVLVAAHPG